MLRRWSCQQLHKPGDEVQNRQPYRRCTCQDVCGRPLVPQESECLRRYRRLDSGRVALRRATAPAAMAAGLD